MKKNILMERIFHDINYDNYVVQYQGDIEAEISKIPDYYVTVINDRYAIVSVKKDVEINMGMNHIFHQLYMLFLQNFILYKIFRQ